MSATHALNGSEIVSDDLEESVAVCCYTLSRHLLNWHMPSCNGSQAVVANSKAKHRFNVLLIYIIQKLCQTNVLYIFRRSHKRPGPYSTIEVAVVSLAQAATTAMLVGNE
jgi:hypothetical protein